MRKRFPSNNFFWFDAAGQLHTPATKLLEGITRALVLERSQCMLSDLQLESVLERIVEGFVTQSTGGITPVRKIGQKILINNGRERISELQQWYRQSLQDPSNRLRG